MERIHKFLLLQVNDALFPIGGYSHSYGLETYIQKGLVTDRKTAEEYMKKRLSHSLCCNELLTVRLAWEYASAGKRDKLDKLEETVSAGQISREIREAGIKLGARFVKTLSALEIPWISSVFRDFVREGKSIHHAVAYGAFTACIGISREESLECYLYAQTSAMVTNCVKTIPLSQSDGQSLLAGMYGLLGELLDRVEGLSGESLGASCPGFDLRCMQHEGLYSRIYMS